LPFKNERFKNNYPENIQNSFQKERELFLFLKKSPAIMPELFHVFRPNYVNLHSAN